MKIYSYLLLALIFLSACKQEPLNVGGGLHTANGKTVLFTDVSVYTVTSKKVSSGSTFRSGYTTHYLSAIDVANGQEIKRVKFGDQKERVVFVASLGGRPWFYSYDPAIGLHCRNAQTLAIEQSAKDILAKNPTLSAGFAEEAYRQGVDSSNKYLFATGKDGYYYLIDPQTLVATRTGEQAQRRFYTSSIRKMNFTVNLNDSLAISTTSGSGRVALVVDKKSMDAQAYAFFSRGKTSPSSKSLYYKTVASNTISGINFIEPILMVNPEAQVSNDYRDPILKTGNTLFVLSKSLLGNTFHWLVSAVEVPYNGEPRQLWHHPIIATERLAWNEKEIRFAGLAGNQLILMFTNTTVALDVVTGKVVWEKEA